MPSQLAEAASAVVLDCGGAEGPLSPQLLALVDVVSPNETELQSLTGQPSHSFTGQPSHSLLDMPSHSLTGIPFTPFTGMPSDSILDVPSCNCIKICVLCVQACRQRLRSRLWQLPGSF